MVSSHDTLSDAVATIGNVDEVVEEEAVTGEGGPAVDAATDLCPAACDPTLSPDCDLCDCDLNCGDMAAEGGAMCAALLEPLRSIRGIALYNPRDTLDGYCSWSEETCGTPCPETTTTDTST